MRYSRLLLVWAFPVLGAAVGCAGPGDRRAAADSAADSAAARLRRCPRALAALRPEAAAAVRCAEWFVARNGYTDLPPAPDTLALVRSFDDVMSGAAGPEVLGERRNALARRAVVLCGGAPEWAPFTVGFAHTGDSSMAYGRAVRMDSAFGGLRVLHALYSPAGALQDTAHCRPAAAVRRPTG